MKIANYNKIANIIDDNEKYILIAIEDKTRKQQYFKQFTSNSLSPGKIVSESFVSLIKLSIRTGETASLKEQYLWTRSMLEARGISRDMFISFFSNYISLVGEVIESFATNIEDQTMCRDMFTILKEEFVNTVHK